MNCRCCGCLKLEAGISRTNKVQKLIGVFADEGFQMVASDIMLESNCSINLPAILRMKVILPISNRRYRSCSKLTSMIRHCPTLQKKKEGFKYLP